MKWLRDHRSRSRCPHSRLLGIYGDETIFGTPKFSRLKCLDCGKFLDGSVALADMRLDEPPFPPEPVGS